MVITQCFSPLKHFVMTLKVVVKETTGSQVFNSSKTYFLTIVFICKWLQREFATPIDFVELNLYGRFDSYGCKEGYMYSHQWSEIYRGTDRMTKKHNIKRMARPLDNKVGAAVMQYWSNKNLIKVMCVFWLFNCSSGFEWHWYCNRADAYSTSRSPFWFKSLLSGRSGISNYSSVWQLIGISNITTWSVL